MSAREGIQSELILFAGMPVLKVVAGAGMKTNQSSEVRKMHGTYLLQTSLRPNVSSVYGGVT